MLLHGDCIINVEKESFEQDCDMLVFEDVSHMLRVGKDRLAQGHAWKGYPFDQVLDLTNELNIVYSKFFFLLIKLFDNPMRLPNKHMFRAEKHEAC